MKSKFYRCLVIGLFLLLPVVAVYAQDSTPTVLRIGTTYIIDSLNPAAGFYGYNPRGLLYETLVEAAEGNKVEPGLAESWNVSDDGLVWTFKIRPNATFSDGTPATAVEAAWTLNWIIENQIPTMVSYLSDVTAVEAPDPTTLTITVSAPVSNMISSKLLYVYILPPHVWQDISPEQIATYDDPLLVTIGAGPYKLADFQPDEYLILQARDDYWRGKPPVDQVIFQQYATDDALIQALMAGEIDLIVAVPTSGVQTLQQTENVTTLISTAFNIADLAINSSADGTQPVALKDPAVRLAMAHAIDKQQIITVAYLGYAKPGTTYVPPGMGIFHNSDIQDVSYDPVEANRILDEAGYVDQNGDGIREDKDGNPLEFRLYTDENYGYLIRAIEIMSDNFKQIGISAPPTGMATDSLTALQIDYDFDMIYWEWNLDADPHFVSSVFTCAETADGGWSDSGYCNPDYDALFQAQATAINDEARKETLWKMQQMIFDDRPWIVIAYPEAISAYRSDRFKFSPDLPLAGIKWALFTDFSTVP